MAVRNAEFWNRLNPLRSKFSFARAESAMLIAMISNSVFLFIFRWIENGEQSVAFRVASWRDQRAAQGDLKIAMENDSNFMAFISNKAIANRKRFAEQLKAASAVTDFDSLQFLQTIHSVLSQMNSPCLRLELLQYILGLDNRYSVAHVKRSVELAATCLNISSESESDALTTISQ